MANAWEFLRRFIASPCGVLEFRDGGLGHRAENYSGGGSDPDLRDLLDFPVEGFKLAVLDRDSRPSQKVQVIREVVECGEPGAKGLANLDQMSQVSATMMSTGRAVALRIRW